MTHCLLSFVLAVTASTSAAQSGSSSRPTSAPAPSPRPPQVCPTHQFAGSCVLAEGVRSRSEPVSLAADCLRLWQLVLKCGDYVEAQSLARHAELLDPHSVEAQHARVVSEIVHWARTPAAFPTGPVVCTAVHPAQVCPAQACCAKTAQSCCEIAATKAAASCCDMCCPKKVSGCCCGMTDHLPYVIRSRMAHPLPGMVWIEQAMPMPPPMPVMIPAAPPVPYYVQEAPVVYPHPLPMPPATPVARARMPLSPQLLPAPPLAPVIHIEMAAPAAAAPRAETQPVQIRIAASGDHVRVRGAGFEARCRNLTLDGKDHIVLDGDVHVHVRKPGSAAQISAQRVRISLKDGSYQVDGTGAMRVPGHALPPTPTQPVVPPAPYYSPTSRPTPPTAEDCDGVFEFFGPLTPYRVPPTTPAAPRHRAPAPSTVPKPPKPPTAPMQSSFPDHGELFQFYTGIVGAQGNQSGTQPAAAPAPVRVHGGIGPGN